MWRKSRILENISKLLLTIMASGLVTAGILAIMIWISDLTRKISILRLFIQIVSTITIFVTLLFLPLPWSPLLTGLTFSIAFRLTIIILLIVGSTIVFGRIFCGWLCPFALYMDLLTRLRKSLRISHWKLSERINDGLDILRYLLIAIIFIIAIALGPLNPVVWQYVIMIMGPFKSLIIVFLLPFDPIITQAGEVFGFSNWGTHFHNLSGIINYFNGDILVSLTWVVFFAFSIGAFMIRLVWCRFCPLGATLSILNRFSPFKWAPLMHICKIEEKCTKCGICKRVCPVQVTDVYEEKGGNVTASKCIHCFRCVEMCPYEGCLEIKIGHKTIYKSKNWLNEGSG